MSLKDAFKDFIAAKRDDSARPTNPAVPEDVTMPLSTKDVPKDVNAVPEKLSTLDKPKSVASKTVVEAPEQTFTLTKSDLRSLIRDAVRELLPNNAPVKRKLLSPYLPMISEPTLGASVVYQKDVDEDSNTPVHMLAFITGWVDKDNGDVLLHVPGVEGVVTAAYCQGTHHKEHGLHVPGTWHFPRT